MHYVPEMLGVFHLKFCKLNLTLLNNFSDLHIFHTLPDIDDFLFDLLLYSGDAKIRTAMKDELLR